MYVKHGKIKALLGVSDSTIRRWANEKKLEFITTPHGQRLYKYNQFTGSNGSEALENNAPHKAIYIRVSSPKQKDDLKRQRDFLLNKFPGYKVYQDIGSGINFKRPGLLSLLQHSARGMVSEVVVASKDRLCRTAFDLIQWQLHQGSTKLVVLDKGDKTEGDEWSDELLSIVQVFCCRWNGKRRYTKNNVKNSNDQTQPNKGTKEKDS